MDGEDAGANGASSASRSAVSKQKRAAITRAAKKASRTASHAKSVASRAAMHNSSATPLLLPGAVADCPMVGAMQVTPATSAGAPSLLDMAASPGARPVALQLWRPAPWRLAPASAAAAPMEPGPERVPAVGADAAMARLSEPSREKAPQGVNFSVLPPPAPAPGAMERKVEVRHHALPCEAA